MSTLERSRSSLAALTLNSVISGENRKPQPLPPPVINRSNRTLLDIIREDKEFQKDKKSWKIFRDKLRLKRTGSAWTSSVHIPASDIIVLHHCNNNNEENNESVCRFLSLKSNHTRASDNSIETTQDSNALAPTPPVRPLFSRGASVRIADSNLNSSTDTSMPGDGPPGRSFQPQMLRYSSIRLHTSNPEPTPVEDENGDGKGQQATPQKVEERTLSAREAVVSQEAAEAEAAAAADEAATDADEEAAGPAAEEATAAEEGAAPPPRPEPVRMSLMDLLEESDRQMGLTGSRYTIGDNNDDYDDDDDDDDEDGEDDDDKNNTDERGELNCCICMVKVKGTAVAPCGHCYCRMCSRELSVHRDNCPACKAFILEILDVF